jgi:hypothetical protein
MHLPLEAKLALRAAVGGEISDFTRWQAAVDLDHLPPGHYLLLPLIYHHLARHDLEHPWLPRIRGVYRKLWYANQLDLGTVAEVVAALQAAGSDTLVVGTAALATTVYPDPALRPIRLAEVVTSDPATALPALLAQGWRAEPAAPDLLRAEFRDWVPGQRFVHANGRKIWVGWHVLRALPCGDVDASAWAAAAPLTLGQTPARTLCPTDLLLAAALTEGEARLLALADVALLLRRGPILWSRLLEHAGRWRLGEAVAALLTPLTQELDVPVPAAVLDDLRRQPTDPATARWLRVAALPPAQRTLADRAWWGWARYARAVSCNGRQVGLGTLTAFLRHTLRLTSAWEIPSALLRRAAGR